MKRVRRPYRRFLLGPLLGMMLSGCAFDGPASIFDYAGPVARAQGELFVYIFWYALAVLILVTAVLAYAVVTYRQRGDDQTPPEQIHGVAWLEAIWTAAPAVILVIIGIPTVALIFETESRVEVSENDLHVNVTGYQWWWEFEYPELGITTANELHIPTDRRIVLHLYSGDVLHSFWVPRLAGKRDLIPNQDNQLWLVADEPGIYYGQCAELCLGAHAYMKFRVIASDDDAFATWTTDFQQAGSQRVAETPLSPEAAAGRELFRTKGCAACHAVAGYASGQAGPDLTHFGQRTTLASGWVENTPENLAAWLRDPQAIKPGNYMPALWTEDDPNRDTEIAAMVAYLESLGGEEAIQATRQAGR